MQKWLASIALSAIGIQTYADDWEAFDLEEVGQQSAFSGLLQLQVAGIYPDQNDGILSKAQLRLEYTDNNDWLKWVVHSQFQAWQATQDHIGRYGPRAPVLERQAKIAKNDDHRRTGATAELDWAYLSGDIKQLNYVVGRQPITLSYGKVWSPADIYAPFNYFDLDRLYKAGVDAVRVNYYVNNAFSTTSVVAGLNEYDASRKVGASQAFNAELSWGRWNLMAARTAYSDMYAFGMQCNDALFKADIYTEWVAHNLTATEQDIWRDDSLISGIIGFSRKATKNSIVTYELLYQSNGVDARHYDTQLINHLSSFVPELGLAKRYHSLSVSTQLTDLVTGEFLALQNLEDSGVNVSGLIKYSVSNNLEARFGFSYAPKFNRETSEYGIYPNVFQVGVNWFF